MKKLLLALVLWFAVSGVALAVVNINTATKEELTSLKGVGEKRAQEIIDYRKKNGDFKTVDDLEKVPGIGPGIMKQIRSNISVTGKTTIDKPAEKAATTKAGDASKSKLAEAKKTEPVKSDKSKSSDTKQATAPKSDAMKAETAKDKVAEKSKADDKKTEKK
jgi:competence protein ComEA